MGTVPKVFDKITFRGNDPFWRSPSVYGGAGGRGVRISTAVTQRRSFDFSSDSGVGLYYNEKTTMQNLNDRLASYLEKVRSLEKANAEWELKIKEFVGQRIVVSHDFTRYSAEIASVYAAICRARCDQTQIRLDIENATLAADDFRMKYESELAMRQAVMTDNSTLKTTLDQLTLSRSNLEMEVERRREELVYMKKTHMEEIAVLKTKVFPNVDVEVDGPPQEDLGRVLEDIRIQYEHSIEKAAREVELWYQKKMTELSIPKCGEGTELDRLRIELSELRRSIQKLEIELQAVIRLKSSLEVALQETQSRYSFQLSQFQTIISSLEADISQMRLDINRQGSEYKMLLDIKIRLEMEIAEYRRLLDGNSQKTITTTHIQVVQEPTMTKRIRTIEEVLVDGKVISHEEEVEVEKLN